MNITEYSSAVLTLDWLRIAIGHTKGFDLWYRSRVRCAYGHEVLIWYHSNPAFESA